MDGSFPAWPVHFQQTYVPAFQENACHLQNRCPGISVCVGEGQQRSHLEEFDTPDPVSRGSELQDCSITGHEETSATDWKLKEWSRLFVRSFKVTKI